MKTINCFDDHAPKRDWLVAFFEQQDDFFEDNTLGPNRFGKDAIFSACHCRRRTDLATDKCETVKMPGVMYH